LLAFTPLESTRNTLALSWGIQTYLAPEVAHTDDMVDQVEYRLRENHLAEEGDRVVVVAGMPPGMVGTTNSIRIHKVGETSKGNRR